MNEKEIVFRTLRQIQEETDKFIAERKTHIKGDNSLDDSVLKIQIEMLCFFDVIVARIAHKNGIKIELQEREDV